MLPDIHKGAPESSWKTELKGKFIFVQQMLKSVYIFFIIFLFHKLFEDPK